LNAYSGKASSAQEQLAGSASRAELTEQWSAREKSPRPAARVNARRAGRSLQRDYHGVI